MTSASPDAHPAGPVDAVVVATAPFGEILFTNSAAQTVSGRRLSDIAGQFEMFHPDGRRYAASEWQLVRALRSGEHIVGERFFRLDDQGKRVDFRCDCSPVRNGDGSVVAAVSITRDVTSERRDEERQRYLAGLVDNTEDGVVALDPSWRLTAWNKGAERLYGWTAGEVLGRHVTEVAELDLTDEERAATRREVAELGRWRGDVRAYRRDGSPVWVDLLTVAIRDEAGQIGAYVGIHRDVTARKRMEDEWRRSETILESVTDAFLALDLAWRFMYVNARALRVLADLLGRPVGRDDVMGRVLWDALPTLDGTLTEASLRAAARDRRTAVFEDHLPEPDRWFEVHVHPGAGGLAVYFRDITRRKLADAKQDRSIRQQAVVADLGQRALGGEEPQAIMDHAVASLASLLGVERVGIAQVLPDGDGLLLRAGAGWEDGAVGRARGGPGRRSLVGYTILAGEPVVSEDVGADARFEISPFLARHAAVSAVTVVIAGRERPFGVLGAFAIERRVFSAEEVDVLQAMANVISTALERAQSNAWIAEAREGERRRIARDLHDEALQDLTDALATAAAGGTAVDMVAALKRAGQQVRAAIYDLRLGAEEQRPFALLLGELVDVQQAIAGDGGIDLQLDSERLGVSLGRPGTEVLRIVGEAIVNARRHSGAEAIRVRATGDEALICVDVVDDGRGFDATATPARASATGLAGMRERAALLGADLDIRSTPGTGTHVHLEVPAGAGSAAGLRPVRMLLVEDHAAVREAMAAMFDREQDFRVVGQATSLQEALAKLRDVDVDVDVAVVDLGLPDGYGGDVITELRRVNPRAQALVLTATADRTEIARAVESGAAGVLDKAVHLDEVVDAVRRLRAGETLMPLEEIVELLRFAARERERRWDERQALESLTPREVEVLQALAEGLDSQAVADRMFISRRTERNHVANILTKLDVHSRLQALLLALRYGVVDAGRPEDHRR